MNAIAPMIEQAEIERSKRKPTQSLEAYDYYLRGLENLHQNDIGEALQYARKAIEIDAAFASAYRLALECYVRRKSKGTHEQAVTEPAEIVRRASEVGKNECERPMLGWFCACVCFARPRRGSGPP